MSLRLNRIATLITTVLPESWQFWYLGDPSRNGLGPYFGIAGFDGQSDDGLSDTPEEYERIAALLQNQGSSNFNDDFVILISTTDRNGRAFTFTVGDVYSIRISRGAQALLSGSFALGRKEALTYRSGTVVRYEIDIVPPPAGIGFVRPAGAGSNARLVGADVAIHRGTEMERRQDFWCELLRSDILRANTGRGEAAFVSPYVLLRCQYRDDLVMGGIVEWEGSLHTIALIQSSDLRFMDIGLAAIPPSPSS